MVYINDEVVFVKDNECVLEMKYVADEFVWIFNSKEMIIEKDSDFYDSISFIMDNNYIFQENIPSFKNKDLLIWLSDQYCDIEDEDSISRVNRLIIERNDDKFILRVYNPFFEKYNINKSFYMISFSPLFNGFYSRNLDSGLTLQDDFCLIYRSILNSNKHVFK